MKIKSQEEIFADLSDNLREYFTSDMDKAVVLQMLRDSLSLSVQNWKQIRDICDNSEESKIAVSFGISIDRSGPKPKVDTQISFAERFKDKRESWVENPDQIKMKFEESSK